MKKSKVIELLRTFSKEEIEELGEFLNSPLFNKGKKITELFQIIKPSHPFSDDYVPDYDKICKKLYPGEKTEKNKIFNLFARLLNLAEDYIVYKRFSKMEVSRKNMLLKEYADRNLYGFFIETLKKAETSCNNIKVVDGTQLYLKFSLQNTRRKYMESRFPVGKREEFFKEIQNEFDSFIYYSVYKLLKYLNELHTHTKLLNLEYPFKMQDEILSFIDKNPPHDYPVIMIYFYLLKMHTDNSETESYHRIRELIDSAAETIDEDDLKEIYAVLYNFTLLHAIKDNQQMAKENFSLVKEMIEKDIHPRDGNFFAENSFITIFRTAMIEGEYGWGYNFLNQYIDKIPPEKRENVFMLCNAIYDYYNCNYERALEKLSRVKLSDFIYSVRVKNFQIRSLWMLEHYDDVLYVIDSFRHTISQNSKMPDYQKVRFINFLNYCQRATKAILSEKKDKIYSLINEIKLVPAEKFENKKWLLENLEKSIEPSKT